MSDDALDDSRHADPGSRLEEDDTISDTSGTDASSEDEQQSSVEHACESEGEMTELPATPSDENGLTIDEACAMIGCSREWLRRKIHAGEIATYRVGTRIRLTRATVLRVPRRQPPQWPDLA